MSDESEDKTEDPTEHRVKKNRESGKIARSKDAATTFVLIISVILIYAFDDRIYSATKDIFIKNYTFNIEMLSDIKMLQIHALDAAKTMMFALLPFLGIIFILGFLFPMIIGGINFSFKTIAFKGERLNPLSWVKKVFSMNTAVELVKSIVKCAAISIAVFVIFSSKSKIIMSLDLMNLDEACISLVSIWLYSMLVLATFTIFIACVDVPYQIFSFKKKSKMSKKEVKDEMKDTEGKPEIKSALKKKMEELRKRKMLDDVAQADVIITNPTHYSVAIKYDSENMGAPVVVAKGVDFAAQMINKIAKSKRKIFVSAPPLARSLYYWVKIGNEIPEGLYISVAKVLSYVYELEKGVEGGILPNDLEIPKEYAR